MSVGQFLSFAAAIALAAIVPSALLTFGAPFLVWTIVPFAIALAAAVLVGLPAFFVFRRPTNPIWSLVAGFTIGALSFLIFVGVTSRFGGPYDAWQGDIQTVQDGRQTMAGLLMVAGGAAFFGVLGTISGLSFWTTMRLTGAIRPAEPTNGVKVRTGLIAATIALAVVVAVLMSPVIFADRTCHSLPTAGRDRLAADVSIEMAIEQTDWPTLTRQIERFASDNGMSFRNHNVESEEFHFLSLSLCNDAMTVLAMGSDTTYRELGRPSLSLFARDKSTEWKADLRRLIGELERTWPGKVSLEGPGNTPLTLDDLQWPQARLASACDAGEC